MNSISLVSRLPQELLDKVIEENEGDNLTLRSSALVCRVFLASSQARIFSHIYLALTESNHSDCCRRLYHVLLDSPHLRPYVRSVCIVEGLPSHYTPVSWVSEDPSLIAVLLLLDTLTSFAFKVHVRDFQWCNLPHELRMAICALCQQPSLVDLTLCDLGNFTDMDEFSSLVASSRLTNIVLTNIVLPRSNEAAEVSYTHLKLHRCSLHLPSPTLDVLMRCLAEGDPLSQLQHLDFVWNPASTSHLQTMVDASASNLETLLLTLPWGNNPSAYLSNNLLLINSTRLRVLTLTFMLDVGNSGTMVPWLAALVESHQTPSALTDLIVKIYLLTSANPLLPIAPLAWGPLADALSSAQFPVLRNVELHLTSMFPGFDAPLQQLVDGAKRGFGQLDVRGVLRCTAVSAKILRM
ncbi:hypothetical protein C8R44DRAFT_806549 [Mycena epipterygia]|nr:hypothetical protein C8R44DRAFT_806549 [Mycena epipterygia]